MASKPNSLLIPFIAVAGLALITAIAWKFINKEEPVKENVTIKTPVKEQTQNVEKKEVLVDQGNKQYKIVSYSKKHESTEKTPEEVENIHKKSKYFMKFNMRYSTPKLALDGLKDLRNQGEDDKASSLIDFINDRFPNTEIPAELLDF